MILSLITQLDGILAPLKKQSFIGGQVDVEDFKKVVLGLDLMGFIPFVMVSRYLAANDQLDWLNNHPGYDQVRGRRSQLTLSAWALKVPRDGNLISALIAEDLIELAIAFQSLHIVEVEQSTGYRIHIFSQRTKGVTSLENESMMFLEVPVDDSDPAADRVVVFNPPFALDVEVTKEHYTMVLRFKKGSSGLRANLGDDDSNLLQWVKKFHADRYKEAVVAAIRGDATLNLMVPKIEDLDQ